jgi:pSer/pThr/pTyr-binding forkhead associated (FHA) protein
VLGRSRECDIRLADVNVSRRHAEVREDGDGYVVVDLGSTNGTLLNGHRIQREPLADGDTITLGSTDVVFTIGP